MSGETALKREFRRICGCWSEAYEPGCGSGVGYPDVQIFACNRLVPIEIKPGILRRGSDGWRIFPKEIRPAQIVWHDTFSKAGGRSYILVMEKGKLGVNGWVLPSSRREELAEWRKGFSASVYWQWIDTGRMIASWDKLLLK